MELAEADHICTVLHDTVDCDEDQSNLALKRIRQHLDIEPPASSRTSLNMISFFSAKYHIFLIYYYRKIDEFEKCQIALQNFLLRHKHRKYYYMIAFDGALKLAEGRIPEAHIRFEECLRKLPDDESEDSKYVALFCKCALSLRDSKKEWRRIRREAIKLRPSRKIRQFLLFPSEESLSKIINLSQ